MLHPSTLLNGKLCLSGAVLPRFEAKSALQSQPLWGQIQPIHIDCMNGQSNSRSKSVFYLIVTSNISGVKQLNIALTCRLNLNSSSISLALPYCSDSIGHLKL